MMHQPVYCNDFGIKVGKVYTDKLSRVYCGYIPISCSDWNQMGTYELEVTHIDGEDFWYNSFAISDLTKHKYPLKTNRKTKLKALEDELEAGTMKEKV